MPIVTSAAIGSLDSVKGATSSQNAFSQKLKETFERMDASYSAIEVGINRALKNDKLSPVQLLALQSGVLRSSLELDITSKIIEKVSNGIKQTMNNQV